MAEEPTTSDAGMITVLESKPNPNKRPKLSDSAYSKLSSTSFMYQLGRGHKRVERLLSKGSELDEQLNVKLNELEPHFRDLFTSVRELKIKDDAAEISRVLSLAKQILRGWEDIENAIGMQQQEPPVSLYMAPIDYPHSVPSAWLLEFDWQDQAYAEVLSLRNKYSYLLDKSYGDIFRAYSERNELSGLTVLSHKKLVNFLASSREEFSFLLKEKCYKWVMDIKQFCTPNNKPLDLVSIRASWSYTDQTQQPYWRDEIYDKIRAARSMYSLKLDEDLREVVERIKAGTPNVDIEARRSNIEKSLAFLANSRADIALLSEEDCRERLAATELFLECVKDSLPAKQLSGGTTMLDNASINWRDRAFEQLVYKGDRFMYQMYDAYLTYKVTWSKIPEFAEEVKKLDNHLEKAMGFYAMHRGTLSYMKSMFHYFELLETLKGNVEESIRLINRLLLGISEEGTEPRWDCKPDILVPKVGKVFG